jgi:hypothetical protein
MAGRLGPEREMEKALPEGAQEERWLRTGPLAVSLLAHRQLSRYFLLFLKSVPLSRFHLLKMIVLSLSQLAKLMRRRADIVEREYPSTTESSNARPSL